MKVKRWLSGPAYMRAGKGISFKCIQCDVCCGTGPNVSLTAYDVIRMASFMNIDWKAFLNLFVDVIIADVMPFMKLSGVGVGRCPFLRFAENDLTYCYIYPARPMKCRLYPFILQSPSSPRLYADPKCPGIGEGPKVLPSRELLERYRREVRLHYKRLHEMIMEEGMEPLEALYTLLSQLEEEYRSGAEWGDLDLLNNISRFIVVEQESSSDQPPDS